MKKVIKFIISFSVILFLFFLFDFQEELKTTTLVAVSIMLGVFITILWDIFEKAKLI